MSTTAKILPKCHSRSQELQARTRFTQILLKSEPSSIHNTRALQPNLFFECFILNVPWSKSHLKVNYKFKKKSKIHTIKEKFI